MLNIFDLEFLLEILIQLVSPISLMKVLYHSKIMDYAKDYMLLSSRETPVRYVTGLLKDIRVILVSYCLLYRLFWNQVEQDKSASWILSHDQAPH